MYTHLTSVDLMHFIAPYPSLNHDNLKAKPQPFSLTLTYKPNPTFNFRPSLNPQTAL